MSSTAASDRVTLMPGAGDRREPGVVAHGPRLAAYLVGTLVLDACRALDLGGQRGHLGLLGLDPLALVGDQRRQVVVAARPQVGAAAALLLMMSSTEPISSTTAVPTRQGLGNPNADLPAPGRHAASAPARRRGWTTRPSG